MDKKTKTLQLFKKREGKGVTTLELARKFGYNNRNSASKLIWLLRQEGHEIDYDNKKGIFVLISNNKTNSKKTSKPVITSSENNNIKSPAELIGLNNDTKKGIVYNMLINRGKEGASVEELAVKAGLKKENVCYHIHVIRRDVGCKINMINGRYIIKNRNIPTNESNNTSPSKESTFYTMSAAYKSKDITISDPDNILNKIGNKKLVMGIHSIRQEDLESYLDLLKNIIYYTKCAESMLETTQLLNEVRKEVSTIL